MAECEVHPFSSPWLNRLLATAFERPTLANAEDAVLLARVFGGRRSGAVDADAVLADPETSDWVKGAVREGLERPPYVVDYEVAEFAGYMAGVVDFMLEHRAFGDREQQRRAKRCLTSLRERGRGKTRVEASSALLCFWMQEAADAGRNEAIHAHERLALPDDPAERVLRGLHTGSIERRRNRLSFMERTLMDAPLKEGTA